MSRIIRSPPAATSSVVLPGQPPDTKPSIRPTSSTSAVPGQKLVAPKPPPVASPPPIGASGMAEVAIAALSGAKPSELSAGPTTALRDEELRQRELQEARKRGYEEGVRQGREAVEQDWKSKLSQLQRLLESLDRQRAGMVASAEDDIVAIAFEAVVKILGDRTVARQMVHAIVKKSLASDQQVGALIVRVSPADYKLLVGELESLQRQGVEGEFRVVEDARVQLGGCLLETDRGVLDARLETQMERLRKALLDAKASET